MKNQWLPGVEGRVKQVEDRGFLGGSKNTLYDILMMNTCHDTFVQTHRLYNNMNEP